MSDIDHGIESTQTNNPNNGPERLDQGVPQQQVPFYRKKAFQALSGLVLVGGAFGIGLSLGEPEDSEQDQEEVESENTLPEITAEESDPSNAAESDISESEPEDDGVQTAQDLQEQNRNREVTDEEERSLPEEYTPQIMTANNPEDLIEQYQHNFRCALNAPAMEAQYDCIWALHGDEGVSIQNTFTELADEYRSWRATQDPEHFSNATMTIMDSTTPIGQEFSENGVEEFILHHVDETPEGAYHRVTFRKATLNETRIDDITQLDGEVTESTSAWVVYGRTVLDSSSNRTLN